MAAPLIEQLLRSPEPLATIKNYTDDFHWLVLSGFVWQYKPFRSDSVELDSDVELLRFESPLPLALPLPPPLPSMAKLIFGPSRSVSNTLADVIGVRYRFRLSTK